MHRLSALALIAIAFLWLQLGLGGHSYAQEPWFAVLSLRP